MPAEQQSDFEKDKEPLINKTNLEASISESPRVMNIGKAAIRKVLSIILPNSKADKTNKEIGSAWPNATIYTKNLTIF